MKAYVITLTGNDYSEACAARCIQSAADHGLEVSAFEAVPADMALDTMHAHGLKWTWAKNNTAPDVCPITGLKQHPYGRLSPKIGCSMSHYLLWNRCAIDDEPLLILEHDAVFLRPLPEVDFNGICMINDPAGATPRWQWWSEQMQQRGPGIFLKTRVFDGDRPDGLAGNSAYLIKPWAAHQLIDLFHRIGVWPNDATMCVQLLPYLQELYPFVTCVKQEQSTSS